MIELKNRADLADLIKEGLVLVDFNATWCCPCRQLKPVLEAVAKENDAIKIISVDVDDNEDLSREYGVMTIPNLKLMKDGKIIKEHIGYMNKDELEEFLK